MCKSISATIADGRQGLSVDAAYGDCSDRALRHHRHSLEECFRDKFGKWIPMDASSPMHCVPCANVLNDLYPDSGTGGDEKEVRY